MTISFSTIVLICGALSLLFAATQDLISRTIPDWCVFAVLAAGCFLRLETGGAPCLATSIGIALALFALLLLLFHFEALGGGDVKLLSASSLLSPPAEVPSQILLIAISGGILALSWIVARKVSCSFRDIQDARSKQAEAITASGKAVFEPEFSDGGLPYGVAICAGTLAHLALLP